MNPLAPVMSALVMLPNSRLPIYFFDFAVRAFKTGSPLRGI